LHRSIFKLQYILFAGLISVGAHQYNEKKLSEIRKCLRRDIGGDYAKVEIEGIFEKFLNIQAFVKSKGEKIHVTYYRYPSELVPLFQNLNEKLKNKGINPAVPWLNNKTLEFHFK
jgi:hypothetical protein